MELQDLKDIYKSKTAEKRYDYYRTLPLDEKDLFGDTLLDIALNFADVEALKILLERNVDVNKINNHGNRPLHNLILLSEYKNLDDVLTCAELLLDNGASVLRKNDIGETPVLSAVRRNYFEILELFIKRNLKLDLKDSYGNGPLHIAAYSCNPNNEEKKKKIFKLLLDAGIENDIKNDNGDTPIDILSNQKTDPILLSILKGKYDFDNPNNITNLTSAMSLYSAILSNNYDVIKAHLEMEIDIQKKIIILMV
ncbi:ankyrin repeat domain-containing protein [Fusobacterium nucleatum subsp. nucleatum ATCC 23726]|uniref:Ankyrin repeat protein n=1 Tax=Fusobacterium nucleatum subsp. nucleatum (strain ATCC 23726 / VPI 4351) TaxID=525283 RepID=D5RBG3_FUSN2|nr:ankyrin repeat domain-containing protein [Fusobacterium nucleatum]EFG95852.1 ankyrin repeat protein [Fusobacterium nucleatum subsp. nucleatum ATCC 23726]